MAASDGREITNDNGDEDEDGENINIDENDEPMSWCGSYKSCQSRLGSESSYYSFDEEESYDWILKEDNKETNKIIKLQDEIVAYDIDVFIHTADSLVHQVYEASKDRNILDNLDDKNVTDINFSEEDIDDYKKANEIHKYKDWRNSNSLSSSGSSLTERSLDSDGFCRTERTRTPALRRRTVSMASRRPWNYAAGNPSHQKQLPWSGGLKKISLY